MKTHLIIGLNSQIKNHLDTTKAELHRKGKEFSYNRSTRILRTPSDEFIYTTPMDVSFNVRGLSFDDMAILEPMKYEEFKTVLPNLMR